jgi:hypothetical protein
VIDFPYDMISSVKLDKGLFSSTAGLRNSGRSGMIEKLDGTEYNGGEEAVITAIPKDKADEFLEVIRNGNGYAKRSIILSTSQFYTCNYDLGFNFLLTVII